MMLLLVEHESGRNPKDFRGSPEYVAISCILVTEAKQNRVNLWIHVRFVYQLSSLTSGTS